MKTIRFGNHEKQMNILLKPVNDGIVITSASVEFTKLGDQEESGVYMNATVFFLTMTRNTKAMIKALKINANLFGVPVVFCPIEVDDYSSVNKEGKVSYKVRYKANFD